MITKYGFDISKTVIEADKKRLINQLWKLIPMRENQEDWQKQLSTVCIEISGLNKVFAEQLPFLVLLSKLEGLEEVEEFGDYRRTIFETISLLGEMCYE